MAMFYRKNHVKQYFLKLKQHSTVVPRVNKRYSSIESHIQPNGSMLELKDKVKGMDRAIELMYYDKAGKDELDSIRNHLS